MAVARSTPNEDDEIISFLLQRSVQTCCHYLRDCRDQPSAKWLAKHANGLDERLHGIDGFSGFEWRAWLLEMMDTPPEEIVVESVIKKNRGLSENNPYAQPSSMTYTYTIFPGKLAKMVMSTAQELAREFAEDLSFLDAEAEGVRRSRSAVVKGSATDIREMIPPFDRSFDDGSTPLRAGTYDLLQVLATRQAINDALISLADRPAQHSLLKSYFDEKGADSMWSGELNMHEAESFLRGLLDQPMMLNLDPRCAADDDVEGCLTSDTSSAPTFSDPGYVCRELLELRTMAGQTWAKRLAELPEGLVDVSRQHLEGLLE